MLCDGIIVRRRFNSPAVTVATLVHVSTICVDHEHIIHSFLLSSQILCYLQVMQFVKAVIAVYLSAGLLIGAAAVEHTHFNNGLTDTIEAWTVYHTSSFQARRIEAGGSGELLSLRNKLSGACLGNKDRVVPAIRS